MSESTAATTSSSQSATAAAAAAGAKFQSASLYVGDLHPDTTEAQLIERFSTVGSVVLVRVCRDKITRQSLGYAYVNYSQPSEAERALDTLNFEPLNGRPMRIMWSQRDPALRKSGVGNVFIKNLDSSIDNKSLYDTFSSFGEIISCKIITDEQNNSKGYGFVHYETKEAADRAARSVNNMIINGKKVYVGPFLSKNERATHQDQINMIFTNLYVKNFDTETTTEEKLTELFGKYGEITSIKLIQDQAGKLLGFGFINFKNPDDAQNALKELNETEWEGKKLYVSRFQKKNERLNFLRSRFEEKRNERLKKFAGVNLYVKNLDDKVDDEKLRKEFAEFGTITSVKVMSEHGRSKGFGFVCYSSSEEATRAVTEMNGKIVGTKPLYVAIAQRKEDRKRILAAQFRERLQTSQFILQQFYNQPLGQQQAAQVQPASAAQNSLYYQYQNQLGMNRYMAPNANPAALNNLANAPYSANATAGYPNPPVRGAVPRWQVNYFPQQQYSGVRSGVTPMQQQQMGYNRNMMNAQSRALSSQQQMQYQQGAIRYPVNAANMNQMRMKAGANVPGQQMPAQQPSAAATINVPGQEPLTTAMLAEAQPQEQKQLIGERLYPLIQSMHAEWAGKITGMLLEIDNAELLHMLDSPESLRAKVEEAVLVLQNHQEKQANMLQQQ